MAAAQLDDAVRHDAGDAARRRGDLGAARRDGERRRTGLATIADGTMERWFTDAFKARNPGRWQADPRHDRRHHAARLSRLRRGDPDFDFSPQLPTLKVPMLVVCGAEDQGTPPAGNKRIAELVPGAPLRGDRRRAAFPKCRASRHVQPHHAGLARGAALRCIAAQGRDARPCAGHPRQGATDRRRLPGSRICSGR